MRPLIGRQALFIGLFCIICGGLLFWISCGRNSWNWFRARDWQPALATVIRSSTRESNESPGVFIELTYAFEANDRSYIGSTYTFSNFDQEPGWAYAMISGPLAPGQQIQIFHDPDQPTESVVDRSFDNRWLWGLLGLVWMGLGGGFMVHDYQTRRLRKSEP